MIMIIVIIYIIIIIIIIIIHFRQQCSKSLVISILIIKINNLVKHLINPLTSMIINKL